MVTNMIESSACNFKLTHQESNEEFARIFAPRSVRSKYRYLNNSQWYHVDQYLDGRALGYHFSGSVTVAVFGHYLTSFVIIDHDLHKGDKAIFLKQLAALVEEFNGDGWHYDVSLSGVHLIRVLPDARPLDEVRDEVRAKLREISARHPDLEDAAAAARMRRISDLDVFPDQDQSIRLPLGTGRITLIDRRLFPRETRTGRKTADVQAYVRWLIDPDRQYLTPKQVIDIVRSWYVWVPGTDTDTLPAGGKSAAICLPSELGPMKGNLGPTLARLRLGDLPPDSLNTITAMYLRLLYAAGLDQKLAVDTVLGEVQKITNTAFSDRLAARNFKSVKNCLRTSARGIWKDNGRQKRRVESCDKLAAAVQFWEDSGLDITDLDAFVARYHYKTTAHVPVAAVLLPVPDLDPDETEKIEAVAAALKCNSQTAAEIVLFFVNFVNEYENEIAANVIPEILESFTAVKWGYKQKRHQFLGVMLDSGFIGIEQNYGAQIRRARKYAVGPTGWKLLEKSRSASPSHTTHSFTSI